MDQSTIRLSPSAVNSYFKCPRAFYYQYIKKLETPPNIHLYKGTFIHRVLETVFANTKYVDIKAYANNYMAKWNPPASFFKDEKDAEFHKNETIRILEMYANRYNDKLEMIILEGKAKDKNHAWNLSKPKLREHKIFDKNLNVVGIIDSIETSYDKITYVIDYKTSKLYRNTVPEDYLRQISIYAYLYQQEFGSLPHYVGINYLRYGEVFVMPVTEETVKKAVDAINLVRTKSVSTNVEDYPCCTSEWCDHYHFEKKEKPNDSL